MPGLFAPWPTRAGRAPEQDHPGLSFPIGSLPSLVAHHPHLERPTRAGQMMVWCSVNQIRLWA